MNEYKIIRRLKKGLAAGMAVVWLANFAACSGPDDIKENYDDVFVEELEPVQLNFYAIDYGGGFNNEEIDNLMKEIEIKLADTIKVKPKFHLIGYRKLLEEWLL